MTLRKFIHTLRLLSIFALLTCGLGSCIYEDLPNPDENPFDTDGFSLGITLSLDNEPQTRSLYYDSVDSDPIDTYIDTRNKLRVFFFDEYGQFIFEATDRTVMRRPAASDGDEWFVHVPVNYIVDYAGKAYDIDALKEQLKTHDFKVAILANWDYRNADGNPTTMENAEPLWGYYNSILCTDNSKKAVKNINDLHHLAFDSIYASGENTAPSSGRPDSYYVYSFLMEDAKMGIRSDWVTNINSDITSTAEAETYIKDNWDPTRPYDAQFSFGYYRNMWYLWNFSAAHESSGTRFSENLVSKNGNNALGWKWVQKNHYRAVRITDSQEVRQRLGNHTTNSPLYNFMNGTTTSFNDQSDDAELAFNMNNYTGDNGSRASIVQYNSAEAYETWGIRLPAIAKQVSSNAMGIRFTASASGTLRIRCASSDGKAARLAIYNQAKNNSNNIDYTNGSSTQYLTRSISITGDSETYYIYCNAGTAVDIFEIEYIKDKYLNDTNRQIVLPSEDKPIPMYGVQNFKKLENWEPGSTFDLSHAREENGNSDDYQVKHISLIRALAKVVIYLPRTDDQGNELTHVYMRSMNRTARCEPMDVESPTDGLWNKAHDVTSSSASIDGKCEWYLIQKHGSFFDMNGDENGDPDRNDSSDAGVTQIYQNKLSWFYGSWLSASWKSGTNGMTGWSFGQGANSENITPFHPTGETNRTTYPHLFNPSINRSDFARLKRDESYVSTYFYRYVFYVPDKNIDDPNYVGVSNSLPKVPHIEYRYNEDALNVDDNNCYRLYFTNHEQDGYMPNPGITSTPKADFENNYELWATNLSKHWPIMRNHVYVFAVNGILTRSGEGAKPTVEAKVMSFSGEVIYE